MSIRESTSSRRTPRPCATWTYSGSSRILEGLMKIALDAVGGDFDPKEVVTGGVGAHRELGVEGVCVGPKAGGGRGRGARGGGRRGVVADGGGTRARDGRPGAGRG